MESRSGNLVIYFLLVAAFDEPSLLFYYINLL